MKKRFIQEHDFSLHVWVTGWLFTIGLADLTFWQGVSAFIVWPYWVGRYVVGGG